MEPLNPRSKPPKPPQLPHLNLIQSSPAHSPLLCKNEKTNTDLLLCAMIPLILAHPRARGLLENAREIGRVVRAFTRAEFSNYQRGLKLDMLSHGPWRERVLKELGGEAKLAAWDAAQERYQLRKETPAPEVKAGTWRKTPERLAEEERLKAHARKCARATAHPRIFRDPYRVDFEGQFRLAPLLRLSTPRRDPATVPFVIEDYNYDGTPIAKMSGFDAPVKHPLLSSRCISKPLFCHPGPCVCKANTSAKRCRFGI